MPKKENFTEGFISTLIRAYTDIRDTLKRDRKWFRDFFFFDPKTYQPLSDSESKDARAPGVFTAEYWRGFFNPDLVTDERARLGWRKYSWGFLKFLAIVFGIGNGLAVFGGLILLFGTGFGVPLAVAIAIAIYGMVETSRANAKWAWKFFPGMVFKIFSGEIFKYTQEDLSAELAFYQKELEVLQAQINFLLKEKEKDKEKDKGEDKEKDKREDKGYDERITSLRAKKESIEKLKLNPVIKVGTPLSTSKKWLMLLLLLCGLSIGIAYGALTVEGALAVGVAFSTVFPFALAIFFAVLVCVGSAVLIFQTSHDLIKKPHDFSEDIFDKLSRINYFSYHDDDLKYFENRIDEEYKLLHDLLAKKSEFEEGKKKLKIPAIELAIADVKARILKLNLRKTAAGRSTRILTTSQKARLWLSPVVVLVFAAGVASAIFFGGAALLVWMGFGSIAVFPLVLPLAVLIGSFLTIKWLYQSHDYIKNAEPSDFQSIFSWRNIKTKLIHGVAIFVALFGSFEIFHSGQESTAAFLRTYLNMGGPSATALSWAIAGVLSFISDAIYAVDAIIKTVDAISLKKFAEKFELYTEGQSLSETVGKISAMVVLFFFVFPFVFVYQFFKYFVVQAQLANGFVSNASLAAESGIHSYQASGGVITHLVRALLSGLFNGINSYAGMFTAYEDDEKMVPAGVTSDSESTADSVSEVVSLTELDKADPTWINNKAPPSAEDCPLTVFQPAPPVTGVAVQQAEKNLRPSGSGS